MSFDDDVRGALGAVEQAGLLRAPRVLEGARGPVAVYDGREVVVLCSNDYLGLAGSTALANAIVDGVEHGAGAGASRHISGTAPAHVDAERSLADYVCLPRALLFATGYAANIGAIQALAGPGDVVFSDALNHASIIDGCRLSRASVFVYPHRDVATLERLVSTHRRKSRLALVVTESLFSMDGDRAPLEAIANVCREHAAGLFVDEAHALGVCGAEGRGLCAEANIAPDVLVGTLGKALGLAGAFVAGSPTTVHLVENKARSFIFSTAPSPILATAIPLAVQLARRADAGRARLRSHAAKLRDGLGELGYRLVASDGPIIPVHVGSASAVMALSNALLEHGVFVHGIRPPTVPEGTSRLRVTPMATHEDKHIEIALRAFASVRQIYQQIS